MPTASRILSKLTGEALTPQNANTSVQPKEWPDGYQSWNVYSENGKLLTIGSDQLPSVKNHMAIIVILIVVAAAAAFWYITVKMK